MRSLQRIASYCSYRTIANGRRINSTTLQVLRTPTPSSPSLQLELSFARTRLVFPNCFTRAMATGADPPAAESKKALNRLSLEKSPYLQQHATNPVDWYPWGEEAFEKARKEDKPIFLSVGYSTCHWCHVMERESFEDSNIGAILSEHFVAIKVDREERPDVDKVYMTYIQATQGGGGWPMSVFLTPQLEPFTGGTYFPPKDQFGRPGFATILKAIAEQWKKDSDSVRQKSSRVMQALRQIVSVSHDTEEEGAGLPGSGCIQRAYQTLHSRVDSTHGGFGSSPKFPQPVLLGFLLHLHARYIGSEMASSALDMVTFTLKAMANGGIHDHVGQGFHRYSTDKFWHVPHFEKMLYDQAQLASVYLDAYQITRDRFFADVVEDILLYVSRDLTDQDGGFYSAEDADSLPLSSSDHKKEGAFCVWTETEIASLLPSPLPPPASSSSTEGQLFSYHYGVKTDGNVPRHKDPHGELTGQNVLIVRGSLEKTAEHFQLSIQEVQRLLSQCREKLAQARTERPKPHRDDKIVTAWNGLMISAFASASSVLDRPDYLQQAVRAAQFVRNHLVVKETGTLLRNAYRDGNGVLSTSTQEGFADDYSFLIRGLLDLFEASQDQQWLEWAWNLHKKQNELFWDEEKGGYFGSTASDPSILLRVKDDQDGSEPSPNSTAASNLLRLSCYLDKKLHPNSAHLYSTFGEMLRKAPVALSGMLQAFMWEGQPPKQIIIAGSKGADDTNALLRVIHSFHLPHKILITHDPSDPSSSFLLQHLPTLSSIIPREGRATVYVCEDFKCSAPVCEGDLLKRLIDPTRHLKI